MKHVLILLRNGQVEEIYVPDGNIRCTVVDLDEVETGGLAPEFGSYWPKIVTSVHNVFKAHINGEQDDREDE